MNPFFRDLPAARCLKTLTLAGGAGAHTDNLFLVQGPIELLELYCVVTTPTAAGLTVAFFDLWDGNASVALSLNNGVISSLPVGSWVGKQLGVGSTFSVLDATTTQLYEPVVAWVGQPVLIVPTSGNAPNHIRLRHTSAGATGGVLQCWATYLPHGRVGMSAA